ncbi:MAG: helix-turn-helix transcriptional regulator [Bdellovibrionales bacterium]|nr:helix-turn-helix transcriptional regulator [Bdellovibrionales bacterium]
MPTNLKSKKTRKSAESASSYLNKRLGPLTLGNCLEAIRMGEELSQTDMARHLGISKSHLCDIEKGRKNVSPAKASQYARALGYSELQFVSLALQDIVKRDGLSYKVSVVAA